MLAHLWPSLTCVPARNAPLRCPQAETRRRIVSEVPIALLHGGHATGWAYDGGQIVLVANLGAQPRLEMSERAANAGWTANDDGTSFNHVPPSPPPAAAAGSSGSSRGHSGSRGYSGTVFLERAGGADSSINFKHFMSSTSADPMRAQVMAMEIVFKHQATSRCKALGDAFYDATKERKWANIRHIGTSQLTALWLGYRSVVVRTENGPMLQIDRAASCMLADIDLLEFISKKIRMRSSQDLRLQVRNGEATLGGYSISAINSKLTEGTRKQASSRTLASTRCFAARDALPLDLHLYCC